MGLSTWKNSPTGPVRKDDVAIAKNYLNAEELETLNCIVNAYLEFAELQAMNRKPMHMAEWKAKLDDFLRLSDREILNHAGTVSRETALRKAEIAYERYGLQQASAPQGVDQDFAGAVQQVKQIEKGPGTPKRRRIKPGG